MQEPDFGEVDTLLRTVFVTERPFTPELRKYLAFQPDGWYLAYLDDVLVEFGGAADYRAFGYIRSFSSSTYGTTQGDRAAAHGHHPGLARASPGGSALPLLLARFWEKGRTARSPSPGALSPVHRGRGAGSDTEAGALAR